MIAPSSQLPAVPAVRGLHNLRTTRAKDRLHRSGRPLAMELRDRSDADRRADDDRGQADEGERLPRELRSASRAEVWAMGDDEYMGTGTARSSNRHVAHGVPELSEADIVRFWSKVEKTDGHYLAIVDELAPAETARDHLAEIQRIASADADVTTTYLGAIADSVIDPAERRALIAKLTRAIEVETAALVRLQAEERAHVAMTKRNPNAPRGEAQESSMEKNAPKDPKARPRGVPFVITAENREAWEGKSGEPARGLIANGYGMIRLDRNPFSSSFDWLSREIAKANAGDEEALGFIETPRVAREIRNRPRLKAMLGGAA